MTQPLTQHAAVDHLVVAAASLEEGVAWCESTLGVTPGPGGKHPLMATHNRLLKIASETFPLAYLEVIAIDPGAPPPGRARWFGLDTLDLSAGPRLLHFVARSDMLDMHRWGLITLGLHPGDPVKASRDTPQGPLSWDILVRSDGALLCGGALPTLIQWRGAHPAQRLAESGVSLQSLALGGVPPRARELLRLRAVSWAETPALTATLSTPLGLVTLST